MRGRDPCRNSDKSYVGAIYFEGPALVDADGYAACLSQDGQDMEPLHEDRHNNRRAEG